MKAKLRDATVCERCNGTGVQVFKIGKYSYSGICLHVPQRELPMEPKQENAGLKEHIRREVA